MGKAWYRVDENWSTFCERGLTGAYLIGPVEEYLEDTTRKGQVAVASYYDMEMKRAYVPAFFEGSNYLGSEYGFIVTNCPPQGPPFDNLPPGILKKFFGYDGIHSYIYKADVEQDKQEKKETTYTGLVAMNPAYDLVPYWPWEVEETTRKKK